MVGLASQKEKLTPRQPLLAFFQEQAQPFLQFQRG